MAERQRERRIEMPPGVQLSWPGAESVQPPEGSYHLFGLTEEQYRRIDEALRRLGRESIREQHLSC